MSRPFFFFTLQVSLYVPGVWQARTGFGPHGAAVSINPWCGSEGRVLCLVSDEPEQGLGLLVLLYWLVRCGCHQAAQRSVNEMGALCPVFDKPEQGLDLLVEAITAANLTPGEDIHIAINAAAHEMFDFVSTLGLVSFNMYCFCCFFHFCFV